MINLHEANSFTDLLTLIQNSRRNRTSKFSYRHLADKLGYRSPRSLAMVHKGQRLPNLNLARKIVHCFGFTPLEAELAFLLLEKAVADKKSLPSIETNQRIAALKVALKNTPPIITEKFIREEIFYLTQGELQEAESTLVIFFSNLAKKYAVDNSDTLIGEKNKYQIQVRVLSDTS